MNLIRSNKRILIPLGLIVVILILSIFRIETIPTLWWDEGWTMSVARNWVELGHYGLLNNGELRSSGMAGHFPVVAAVALSFKILGIGVWQARLPFVFYTLGTFGLLFFLADKLYSRKAAYGTLVVLLLLTGSMYNPPIIEGKQVLGELPGIFFVLLGFIGLYYSFYRSNWYILITCLFWGLALITKSQIFPFWVVSLSLPLLTGIYKRWWSTARTLAVCLAGSWIISKLIPVAQLWIIGDQFINDGISGLINITALVTNPTVRAIALIYIIGMGILPIIAVFTAFKEELTVFKGMDEFEPRGLIRLMLMVYVGSWLAWYACFGMWWPRYLVPPMVIGSIFVSSYLINYLSKLNIRILPVKLENIDQGKKRPRKGVNLHFVFIMVVVLTTALFIIYRYIWIFNNQGGLSYREVISYLNNETSEDSIIETYDSELFFLLERTYHYPPDALFIDLVRIVEFDLDDPIPYDPLGADPDYIVVGYHSNKWKLYNDALSSGEFSLVKDFPGYQVYVRVRE